MTGFGVTVGIVISAVLVWFGWRNAKLRGELSAADNSRSNLEHQFQATSREFAGYRDRVRLRFAELREDIGQLEDDLDACSGPGDRRRRLERLLSKADDDSTSRNGAPKLP